MVAQVPTRAELIGRASKLVPLLRANADWVDEHRRLNDEVIEALADAGVFKLRLPKRYGGYECDAQTLVDVGTELGRGDGSAAWTAAVYWIPGWMVGRFPEHVQDEVFSTPDVRVCGTLSPGGMATPANGGALVNGQWGFMTGAWHSHWQEIIAISVAPEREPEPIVALVPMTDLEIVDDWHTTALRGTGSVTTVAKDVFIPDERILPLGAVLGEQDADSPMYRAPLLPVASVSSVGTVIGLAHAAKDVFIERLDRKLTYTSYESRRQAPVTHMQLAEASLKIDQADFHARRVASEVDAKSATGEPWTVYERARIRADLGAACQLAKESVDILSASSGGSSIYNHVPIQRINRDVQAINLHALMAPQTNYELYGRVLCGLEPNTQYL